MKVGYSQATVVSVTLVFMIDTTSVSFSACDTISVSFSACGRICYSKFKVLF